MSLRGLFVVGTDTGVGKTRVACSLVKALSSQGRKVGAIKPVATGATRTVDGLHSEDAELLRAALPSPVPIERVCPILYEEPLAPPIAARRQGQPLTATALRRAVGAAETWWAERAEFLVIEGVGGILCPIAEGLTVADLAVELDYPVLVVARRALGTLNHTLLTIEAARTRGLRIAGLVLNGAEPTVDPVVESSNADELARRLSGIAIFPDIVHGQNMDEWAVAPSMGSWYDRGSDPRGRLPSPLVAEASLR